MQPHVYTCGPINGETFVSAGGWRNYVTSLLLPEILTISPMRHKDHMRDLGVIQSEKIARGTHPLTCSKGIVTRDRFDVSRSNLVLANFLPQLDKISVGSMIELGWADMQRIPIVCVMTDKSIYWHHPFINELAGYIVPTLDDAVKLIKAILLP